jgi:uncharacterized protein (TIGR02145 family)
MKKALLLFASLALFSCSSDEAENNPTLPVLTTTNTGNITLTSASSGGNITADGNADITARGVVWNTSSNPTISLTTKTTDGTGIGLFTSNLTNLTPNTTYYVRAYATNSVGTTYGNEVTFTTSAIQLPVLTTSAISNITQNTASSGGNITSDGGGAITSRGVVWNTTQNPTIALSTKTTDGSGSGAFTSNITNLTPNTQYYVRAYATNSAGTAYGNEVNYTTNGCNNNGNIITDIDGNTYNTVIIGTQRWMKENLKTTKFQNGDVIPNITDNTLWNSSNTPAWSSYNNQAINDSPYGKYYNGFVVLDSRNPCPCGYRIPTVNDFNTLLNFLGNNADIKLKTVGNTYWIAGMDNGTNESGFSAVGSGSRYNGVFSGLRMGSDIWTNDTNYVLTIESGVQVGNSCYTCPTSVNNLGNPIRCIKE